MFQLFYIAIHWVAGLIHSLLVPICFSSAWIIVALTGWSVLAAMRDGLKNVEQLHKIPCADCRFFTGDYHLKCTVHPDSALSEDAINCIDFETESRSTALIQGL